MTAFTGLRLYKDPEGNLQVQLFQNGMITPLEPNEEDEKRELGFYDFDMEPVPDPTSNTAKMDSILEKLKT